MYLLLCVCRSVCLHVYVGMLMIEVFVHIVTMECQGLYLKLVFNEFSHSRQLHAAYLSKFPHFNRLFLCEFFTADLVSQKMESIIATRDAGLLQRPNRSL